MREPTASGARVVAEKGTRRGTTDAYCLQQAGVVFAFVSGRARVAIERNGASAVGGMELILVIIDMDVWLGFNNRISEMKERWIAKSSE